VATAAAVATDCADGGCDDTLCCTVPQQCSEYVCLEPDVRNEKTDSCAAELCQQSECCQAVDGSAPIVEDVPTPVQQTLIKTCAQFRLAKACNAYSDPPSILWREKTDGKCFTTSASCELADCCEQVLTGDNGDAGVGMAQQEGEVEQRVGSSSVMIIGGVLALVLVFIVGLVVVRKMRNSVSVDDVVVRFRLLRSYTLLLMFFFVFLVLTSHAFPMDRRLNSA
jgi:hypothetical protein